MSEGQGEVGGEPQGQAEMFTGGVEGTPEQQPQDTGSESINPAWNEMLSSVPQQYHSQIVPHLKGWDSNVQQQFQKVHSQYEPYKAYEPFVESNVTPDEINFAMGLLNAVNNDPQSVMQALDAWMKEEGVQDQQAKESQGGSPYGVQGQQEQPELLQHPEYQKMQSQVEAMANILLTQREQEEQQQADELLDKELAGLKEQFGEYDEQFVVARMVNGQSGEEAVKDYQNLVNGILTNQRKPGPKVLGAGAALPSSDSDVRKMSGKETRSFVADYLKQAQQNE